MKLVNRSSEWIIRNNGDTLLHLAAERDNFEIF